ncbi:MAG: DoxX-like family protein [Chloroflexi bacterium]|nr:DoxX-like family protein [Chloroflexota bacterium]MCI0643663.1 DoxX-like family protein [Chloroflexota bacterium]
MKRKPIYVEIEMNSAAEEVWRLTQTPDLHEQWDLRFSSIDYLPRPDENAPQQFLYTTRIGFGLTIAGEGESVGTRHKENGQSTSALKFWSDDPKSLIRRGSGYWKYIPNGQGVRFLTWYDYDTRFGPAGRLVDNLVFRPLLGWATAWSFDRLRLWLEKGVPPAVSFRLSLAHVIARLGLAAAWIYQGLVPKLLFPEMGELDIWRSTGLFPGLERGIVGAVGLAQIVFGLLFLLAWRGRGLFIANVVALAVLAVGAAASLPSLYTAPFSPASLSLAMIALSLIGFTVAAELPSARRCRRRPED